MKRTLLLLGLVLNLSAYSQVTLFQDNFESGAGSWTLNSGGSGLNQWVVNTEYLDNSGFDLVDPTPDQPVGTTNGPNSSYLHIYNTQACSGLSICNASFDTGSSSNRNAMQASSISTSGFNNVTLEFIYLCDGASGTSYGVVEYSTDNGANWTAASTQYSGVSTWTDASITLPAFNNQAQLKFRFRWQNGGTGNDPAFAVDEVVITGEQGNFVNISTGLMGTNSFCTNSSAALTVPFTATGVVNAGNQYIAQLSNNVGSFAAPTTIGSLTSTSTGSLSINATIPSGLTAGTGYLVRVIATDPSATGTNSSTTLSVNTAPSASIISLPSNPTICEGESITLQGNGGATYSWSPSASVDNPNLQTVSATPTVTTVYTVTVLGQNGCTSTASITVNVDDCASINDKTMVAFQVYPNPTSEHLFITNEGLVNVTKVEIVDLAGRTIKSFHALPESISVQELPQGTFLLNIQHQNGMSTVPFIKK